MALFSRWIDVAIKKKPYHIIVIRFYLLLIFSISNLQKVMSDVCKSLFGSERVGKINFEFYFTYFVNMSFTRRLISIKSPIRQSLMR